MIEAGMTLHAVKSCQCAATREPDEPFTTCEFSMDQSTEESVVAREESVIVPRGTRFAAMIDSVVRLRRLLVVVEGIGL